MQKFSNIEQFRHIVRKVRETVDFSSSDTEIKPIYPIINFIGTVKLHGSNCSIVRKNGKIICQSRNSIITIKNDNYGFAGFINEIPECNINELIDKIGSNPSDEVVLYGELIGKGIQKKVAVSKIEPAQWVLFSAKINDEYVEIPEDCFLPEYNIFNINQVSSYNITIDFNNLEPAIEQMNKFVKEVEDCCPWGKLFEVNGSGEGIVWKSKGEPYNSRLWFKTKGEKHKISKEDKKSSIGIAPEIQKSIDDFVNYSVSENRLHQGFEYLKSNNLSLDIKNLGQFIKWMNIDIKKEEYDVMEENNFEWKQVAKSITRKSKDWFIEKINKEMFS